MVDLRLLCATCRPYCYHYYQESLLLYFFSNTNTQIREF